ncbi:unnamed protein product [Clonostachys chloroleuca]|uniref:Major facilitator superfamily (MFS) profile domain-containing protein n=1 Tax=Clonostachys chloroleuca TaxID=1926264 RepID=A0AA35M065_9HYPO|nr:unnamed protein product [Clonostachys chloroleuca]
MATPSSSFVDSQTLSPQNEDKRPQPSVSENIESVNIDGVRHQHVVFSQDDPENPKNWPKSRKWYCTMVIALTCFVVAFSSAVITADVKGVVDEFAVSEEVALVSISIFVVGFGIGPMVFSPLSEIFGRRII